METIILLAVFAFVFLGINSLLTRKQAKYSRLEIRRVVEEPEERLKMSKEQSPDGFKGLLKFLNPLVQQIIARQPKKGLARDLVTAGKPLTMPEFYALTIVVAVIFFVLGVIFLNVSPKGKVSPFAPLILAIVGYALPGMWLKQKVKKRQHEIGRDLPSVIDLLNLCVGSGVDFMLAVHRVIKDYRKCALIDELSILWQENNMGVPRKDALRSLSWRANMPEMSSFVSTLIQADKMGSPISDALEIQAEQMRIRRFQRGEENALKAPIKMLIPLIFFILPVVAIIVAAPILIQFVKGGIKF